jgi:hypothetical protein
MSDDDLLPPPPVGGQILDAQLHLLDRQVLDVDKEPVAAVDDVELAGIQFGDDLDPDKPPVIGALVSGAVLATRLFGGRPPDSRLKRIPWKFVADAGTVIRLGIRADELDITWAERWLRTHVIGRIPGGQHDPE